MNLKGKCAKQTTIAIIVNNDNIFIGSNWCKNPQTSCPRENMKTGEGYHLCKEICNQQNHAEVDALIKAGSKALGGTLILIGHTYLCGNCKKAVSEYGINNIIILDDLKVGV